MKEGRGAASRRTCLSPDLHREDVVPTRVQSGRNGVERRRWSSGSSSANLIKNQFICLLTLSPGAPPPCLTLKEKTSGFTFGIKKRIYPPAVCSNAAVCVLGSRLLTGGGGREERGGGPPRPRAASDTRSSNHMQNITGRDNLCLINIEI